MKTKNLQSIMKMAWQFVKKNGYSMSEALKVAWANFKLKTAMSKGIVKFYFQKISGETREAYGTLKSELMPEIQGNDRRAKNPTVQVYYDTEIEGFRCFKIANLLNIK